MSTGSRSCNNAYNLTASITSLSYYTVNTTIYNCGCFSCGIFMCADFAGYLLFYDECNAINHCTITTRNCSKAYSLVNRGVNFNCIIFTVV